MKFKIILAIGIMVMVNACENSHFITDEAYRNKVEKRFEERKAYASERSSELFGVFNSQITLKEKEALMFLYAYMPLNDLADYNGEFFLKQVRTSFGAKSFFPWGKTIPEDIFRHFVLPYRVNNENLDSARWVFLNELKPRLKELSMKEAALEVNHWCHEKVNYHPTDIRTSGPLSTVKTSYGRCGEESTFTVTAMRSVGIPARQVYTPRWAHCDDNHAWVEVWVDGKWHYLGACEPAPELDMGWFTEPARRAMLVHTKVFGDYTGNDEVVQKTENFTEINVIQNYAETKKIFIQVVDKENNPVGSAKVDFGLYNYAEFYPIASKITNSKGIASLTTGMGDLLIWVHKGGDFNHLNITVSKTDTLTIVLGEQALLKDTIMDFHPPVEPKPFNINQKDKEANDKRLAIEDSMRNCYKATFVDSLDASKVAKVLNIDEALVWKHLDASEGNWMEIKNFIEEGSEISAELAMIMLEVISSKDLRDVESSILIEHLKTVNVDIPESIPDEVFYKYILNPRIRNEKLTSYRNDLKKYFEKLLKPSIKNTVFEIINWIKFEIEINEEDNYYNLPITPIGVLELKKSNIESRDIFFVAVCRSIGIPARLEPKTKIPQYFHDKNWSNVYFESSQKTQPLVGKLILDKSEIKDGFEPMYYTNFSIAKLNNGVFETLDFGWDTPLSKMPDKIELEVGEYRLLTGVRQKDGSVLAAFIYFEILPSAETSAKLVFREEPKVDSGEGKAIKTDLLFSVKNKLKNFSEIDNYKIVAWIDKNGEPSKHLLNGLKKHKNSYDKTEAQIVVIPSGNQNFTKKEIEELPQYIEVARDTVNVKNLLLKELQYDVENYPLVFVFNEENKMIYKTSGYNISMAEDILKEVSQ